MSGNGDKLFISAFALTLSPDSLWAILQGHRTAIFGKIPVRKTI